MLHELQRFVGREDWRLGLSSRFVAWRMNPPWTEVLPAPAAEQTQRLAGRVPSEDEPVVAAALAARVPYFVTGDRRLLAALPGVGLRPLAPADIIALHASGDWPWA